jgi:hypothetical protein
MKNKMVDVRNHLCAMLEALGDPEATADVVERAKATSLVANSYIAAVKTEIDAIRLADEIGKLPQAVLVTDIDVLPDPKAPLRLVSGG